MAETQTPLDEFVRYAKQGHPAAHNWHCFTQEGKDQILQDPRYIAYCEEQDRKEGITTRFVNCVSTNPAHERKDQQC